MFETSISLLIINSQLQELCVKTNVFKREVKLIGIYNLIYKTQLNSSIFDWTPITTR
jgi:hypothetical protein